MSNNRNNEVKQFSEMFKALSNPHRLRIFMRLVDCCGKDVSCCSGAEQIKSCVGQLGNDLEIVPSTVSHHIKELHRAGLIRMERCGQKIDCSVDPEAVQCLTKFFAGLGSGGRDRKQ